jgi:hypothetical protein
MSLKLTITEAQLLDQKLHQSAKWLGLIDLDFDASTMTVRIEVEKETDDYIGMAESLWKQLVDEALPGRILDFPPVFRTALTIDSHVLSFDISIAKTPQEVDGFALKLYIDLADAPDAGPALLSFPSRAAADHFLETEDIPENITLAEATLYNHGHPIQFSEYDDDLGWCHEPLDEWADKYGYLPHPKKKGSVIFLEEELSGTAEPRVLHADALAEDGEPMDVFILTKRKVKTPISLKKLKLDVIEHVSVIGATDDLGEDEDAEDILFD